VLDIFQEQKQTVAMFAVTPFVSVMDKQDGQLGAIENGIIIAVLRKDLLQLKYVWKLRLADTCVVRGLKNPVD